MGILFRSSSPVQLKRCFDVESRSLYLYLCILRVICFSIVNLYYTQHLLHLYCSQTPPCHLLVLFEKVLYSL